MLAGRLVGETDFILARNGLSKTSFHPRELRGVQIATMSAKNLNNDLETITVVSGSICSLLLAESNIEQLRRIQ